MNLTSCGLRQLHSRHVPTADLDGLHRPNRDCMTNRFNHSLVVVP